MVEIPIFLPLVLFNQSCQLERMIIIQLATKDFLHARNRPSASSYRPIHEPCNVLFSRVQHNNPSGQVVQTVQDFCNCHFMMNVILKKF